MKVSPKTAPVTTFGSLSEGEVFRPSNNVVICMKTNAPGRDGGVYSNAVRLDTGTLHNYSQSAEVVKVKGTFVEE